jgi:hypothetical protein
MEEDLEKGLIAALNANKFYEAEQLCLAAQRRFVKIIWITK